jgi:hypothetical protein
MHGFLRVPPSEPQLVATMSAMDKIIPRLEAAAGRLTGGGEN